MHSGRALLFSVQALLRPKKLPGLLIISISNGLFKTGCVKVRAFDINHADSSLPPVELATALGSVWRDQCVVIGCDFTCLMHD